MSFSGEVRQELAGCMDPARHCRIAFLCSILHGCGRVREGRIVLQTENLLAADAFAECLKRTFAGRLRREETAEEGRLKTVTLCLEDQAESLKVMEAVRMTGAYPDGNFRDYVVDRVLLQKSCCRRAYLRGAFLLSGSVSNPEKAYHLELVCPDLEEADLLLWILSSLGCEARLVERQRRQVVYLKEGEAISDLLGTMGGTQSLLKLENARIVRDIAGTVNRRVNCETANLKRTVDASVRQMSDIAYLRDHGGLDRLPDQLRQVADLRLAMPDATLKELSEASQPRIGKSGVNHRLMKLSAMAEAMRTGGLPQ